MLLALLLFDGVNQVVCTCVQRWVQKMCDACWKYNCVLFFLETADCCMQHITMALCIDYFFLLVARHEYVVQKVFVRALFFLLQHGAHLDA